MKLLLYFACGPHDLHVQGLYAMYSALAHGDPATTQIHLYTDSPQMYEPLAALVAGHEMTPARIQQFRGPGDYPFRMKIAAVADLLRANPEAKVLYADVDTFYTRPYDELFAHIGDGTAVLHRREYAVPEHDTGQLRRFRRSMRRFGKGMDLSGEMWNSGVIGVCAAHLPAITEMLETIDTVSPHYKKALVEQYAVSLALQKRVRLHAAEEYVFHYWYQKPEYQRVIAQRLDRWRGGPLEEALEELRQGAIVLKPAPLKKRFWRGVLERLALRAPVPEVRGLPKR